MRYRFWCGECGFRTPWGDEAEGRLELLRHCRRWHGGIAVGGHRETARGRAGGRAEGRGGRLVAVGVVLLLVVLAVVLVLSA